MSNVERLTNEIEDVLSIRLTDRERQLMSVMYNFIMIEKAGEELEEEIEEYHSQAPDEENYFPIFAIPKHVFRVITSISQSEIRASDEDDAVTLWVKQFGIDGILSLKSGSWYIDDRLVHVEKVE